MRGAVGRAGRRPLTASRVVLWTLGLAGLLAACLLVAASLGAGRVSLVDALVHGAALSEVDRTILFSVRLPRVLLAALLGGALTVAGVAAAITRPYRTSPSVDVRRCLRSSAVIWSLTL